jgi:hypothetical protein
MLNSGFYSDNLLGTNALKAIRPSSTKMPTEPATGGEYWVPTINLNNRAPARYADYSRIP